MFLGEESATAFMERTWWNSDVMKQHFQMTANFGWIYIVFAIGCNGNDGTN